MALTLEFNEEAEEEIDEALIYYGTFAGDAVSRRLAAEIRSALKNIAENPELFPLIEDEIRRCVVSRFPYSIIYEILSNKVYIIAFVHGKRRPGYWRHRE